VAFGIILILSALMLGVLAYFLPALARRRGWLPSLPPKPETSTTSKAVDRKTDVDGRYASEETYKVRIPMATTPFKA
jgi:hypothetical protein